MNGFSPLLRILRSPVELADLTEMDWDILLRQARKQKLLARLGTLIEDQHLEDHCPQRARDIIRGDTAYVEHLHTQARREVRELHKALAPRGIPIMLLKGAAYLMAGLPMARGRHIADVDILIPERQLEEAERALQSHGWQMKTMESYDEHYYRTWMHELPPMTHRRRALEVDIHHSILPRTSRLHPDSSLLWEASSPLGDDHLRLPSPLDMFLHSATHLFYDSDLKARLRDLVDLDRLFKTHGATADFERQLIPRAARLDLLRPLHYALTLCPLLLGTPVSPQLQAAARAGAPPWPVERLTTALCRNVLTPPLPEQAGHPVAEWLLYLRSHWLRMPPLLLGRHLLRKARYRLKTR